jgi:hypothetical protein
MARACDCTDSDVNALARSKMRVSTSWPKFDSVELSLFKPAAAGVVPFCINTGRESDAIMKIVANNVHENMQDIQIFIVLSLYATIMIDFELCN